MTVMIDGVIYSYPRPSPSYDELGVNLSTLWQNVEKTEEGRQGGGRCDEAEVDQERLVSPLGEGHPPEVPSRQVLLVRLQLG
jgi:hypothetical protein